MQEPVVLTEPVVSVEGLSFTYAGAAVPALDVLHLKVMPGEFVAITGPSGCGKSTLALCLTGFIPHAYAGEMQGIVRIGGLDTQQVFPGRLAGISGLVQQDPEAQLCTLKVIDEVAFGPENLCLPSREIKKRVEWALEAVDSLDLKFREVHSLSGGEKQRVAIASVLAMTPGLLILDEPTANLDPRCTVEVLTAIENLRREKNTAIIVIEHRLRKILPLADRLVVMEKGKITADGKPVEINAEYQKKLVLSKKRLLADAGHAFTRTVNLFPPQPEAGTPAASTAKGNAAASPLSRADTPAGSNSSDNAAFSAPLRKGAFTGKTSCGNPADLPLSGAGLSCGGTFGDVAAASPAGTGALASGTTADNAAASPAGTGALTGGTTKDNATASPLSGTGARTDFKNNGTPLLVVENVTASYNATPVIDGINFTLYPGEFLALMGDNGSGKTSLLHTLLGILKPEKGRVVFQGRDITAWSVARRARLMGLTFQNPNHQLFEKTVLREAQLPLSILGSKEEGDLAGTENFLDYFGLRPYVNKIPQALSMGEKKRLTLVSVLAYRPPLLLLDEPLVGQDAENVALLQEVLHEYRKQGGTVLMVCHEPAAVCSFDARVLFLETGKMIIDAPAAEALLSLQEKGYKEQYAWFTPDN